MSDHTGADGENPVDHVCHDEQMTIWTGEIVDSLSMGSYFRERLSYDDGLHIHAVIARDLRSIIASAFLQAEPAPCDEPPSGRDRNGLGGDSPAGAVAEGQAPNNTMSTLTAHLGSDDAVSEIPTLKAEIGRLTTALAESERKRVEAVEALKPFALAADHYEPDEGDGDHSLWADDGLRVRHLRAALSALITQEVENGR